MAVYSLPRFLCHSFSTARSFCTHPTKQFFVFFSTGQDISFKHFSFLFFVWRFHFYIFNLASCVVRFLYSLSTMYDSSFEYTTISPLFSVTFLYLSIFKGYFIFYGNITACEFCFLSPVIRCFFCNFYSPFSLYFSISFQVLFSVFFSPLFLFFPRPFVKLPTFCGGNQRTPPQKDSL